MFIADQVFEQMTLKEKIAQMFLQYYQGYDKMPEKFVEMNRKDQLGGFIFFSGNNVKSLHQLKAMTEEINSHIKESKYQIPFWLTIDQEGGQLTAIFNGTTIFPGNMTLGFANDQDLAKQQGHHVGQELRYAGINLCYAPVLDVDYDAQFGVPIVDNRRYSTDPQVVADMGSAFISGMQSEGLYACGKHFPGMRITEVDTHFQVDRNPEPMKRLESVEMVPFKQAIEKGLNCIMTHHGIFEALDPALPASLSPKVIGYLREKLGFKGLVVTDDLVMKAILNEYGEKESIKLAINAGSDLIISTCASDWFVDYVDKCVQTGDISEQRINDAAYRILKAKEELGKEQSTKNQGINTIDHQAGKKLSKDIAKKGIVLYKGKQEDLPIKLDNKKVGIVFGNPARLVMSDATNLYDLSLRDILTKVTGHEEVKEAIMPWHPTDEEIISLTDVGIISDLIIFSTVNAYRFTRQIDVLKEIRAFCPNKTIIAIASRSPMDAKLLSEYADIVIITGGIIESTFEAVFEKVFRGR